jgi:hypothetical protein
MMVLRGSPSNQRAGSLVLRLGQADDASAASIALAVILDSPRAVCRLEPFPDRDRQQRSPAGLQAHPPIRQPVPASAGPGPGFGHNLVRQAPDRPVSTAPAGGAATCRERRSNLHGASPEDREFRTVVAELPEYARPFVVIMYLRRPAQGRGRGVDVGQSDFAAGVVSPAPGTARTTKDVCFRSTRSRRCRALPGAARTNARSGRRCRRSSTGRRGQVEPSARPADSAGAGGGVRRWLGVQPPANTPQP